MNQIYPCFLKKKIPKQFACLWTSPVLATHYKVDLTPRKATVKLMIQEELTKLADEAEENQYGGDSEKEEEHPKAQGKKVEL